jgi:hypothetical protein
VQPHEDGTTGHKRQTNSSCDDRDETQDDYDVRNPLTWIEVSLMTGEGAGEAGLGQLRHPAHITLVEAEGLADEHDESADSEKRGQQRDYGKNPTQLQVDSRIRLAEGERKEAWLTLTPDQ